MKRPTKGLVFPFQRDGRGDFMVSDVITELLESSMVQILGTRGAGPRTQGELPWRTNFGSGLHRLRFANNDEALIDIARYFVVDAVGRFEPRADLAAARVEPVNVNTFNDGLQISLDYRVRVEKSVPTLATLEVTL
jgi:hypothetical protein